MFTQSTVKVISAKPQVKYDSLFMLCQFVERKIGQEGQAEWTTKAGIRQLELWWQVKHSELYSRLLQALRL